MQYLYGRIETEAKQLGTEGYDALLTDAVKVKRAELFERISSGRLTVVHEMRTRYSTDAPPISFRVIDRIS
jgi:hypothetical protein